MSKTPLVTRVDQHLDDAAQALDLASAALIRAQELAGQDTTGAAPARLAQTTAALRSNLRMLADMLTSPPPATAAGTPSREHRRSLPAAPHTETTHPAAQSGHPRTPALEARHGRA